MNIFVNPPGFYNPRSKWRFNGSNGPVKIIKPKSN